MATYDIVSTDLPEQLQVGDVINCSRPIIIGDRHIITLPPGTYKLECWGAQGGYRSSSTYGGKGGYSYGTLTLTKKTTLELSVGQSGNSGTVFYKNIYYSYPSGGYRYGYPGGGSATSILIYNEDGTTNAWFNRVIVAGGGGSDGSSSKKGMYGGGTAGGSSTESFTAYSNYCGKGGNTTYSGYSSAYTASDWPNMSSSSAQSDNTEYQGGFGWGGTGVYLNSGYGGAGGGGWYGGSGTIPDSSGDDDRGGGGGSGYVLTSSTASQAPSSYVLGSEYYLTNAATVSGNSSFTSPSGSTETGHSGDGHIKITVQDIKNTGIYVKTNSLYDTALPSGYTELQYITTSGNAYINTNYLLSYLYRVEIKASIPSNAIQQPLFGAKTSNNPTYSFAVSKAANYIGFTFERNSNDMTFESSNQYYNYGMHTISFDSQICKLDNTRIGQWGTLVNFSTDYPCYICSINIAGTADTNKFTGSLYSFKIYNRITNQLLRNYIPCKNSSGTVGVYETIQGQFLSSATSTAFTAGPVKEGNYWKKAKKVYIKTDSTTWNSIKGDE